MPDSKPDDLLLLIRCPSCGQRFKVGEDLRGRTVECGGCEHRFRINDDVIVRGKKFYPGERRDARLERFHRVPLAVAPPIMGTQMVRYDEPPDPASYEPATPQRILAGFIGVCLMSLMALLLMFGARRGGMLDGMLTSNRLMMAGFTGLLGTVLLVYANPRGRGKAVAVGLLFSGGLVGLPFFFTTGSVPLAGNPPAIAEPVAQPAGEADQNGSKPGESDEITELRQRIGTDPLVEENQRLQLAGSTNRAIGLWLRDMREQNRYLIRDYILRITSADPQSHFYPRGRGDFLMVVTGITMPIDEVAKLAAPLGSVERIHPEIDVIEVKVNNENFIEGPIEKLNDRASPAFYDLNKRELESIDLTRAEKAVWAPEPGLASDAALREVREMLAHGVTVPQEMVELVVRGKNPGVLPVIHELWESNPQKWEFLYGEVGPPAEQALLLRFPTVEGPQRHSIVRLLGKVGGTASLPLLESAMQDANPELRVLLEKSIRSIRERGAP